MRVGSIGCLLLYSDGCHPLVHPKRVCVSRTRRALALWFVVANVGTMVEARVGDLERQQSCGAVLARFVSTESKPYAILASNQSQLVSVGFWTWHVPILTRVVSKNAAIDVHEIRELGIKNLVLVGDVGDVSVSPVERLIFKSGDCRAYAID